MFYPLSFTHHTKEQLAINTTLLHIAWHSGLPLNLGGILKDLRALAF
jgi:hypothetical protein